MDAEDADSDWEEGRTLVPPDDEDVIKAAEHNAYLNEMIDTLSDSFAGKNAAAKPDMLAALEPALDIIAGVHSFLRTNADGPFLKGIESFDEGSGKMHGAIVASSEALSKSIPTTRNELQTLFAKLNVLYKERNTMVEGCYQRAQECAKQLEKVLEDGDAALDTIEQDSDRKEKQLLKQGASVSGTSKASKKADTNKLLKQLLS